MKYPQADDFGVRSPDLHNTNVIGAGFMTLQSELLQLVTILASP